MFAKEMEEQHWKILIPSISLACKTEVGSVRVVPSRSYFPPPDCLCCRLQGPTLRTEFVWSRC